MGETTLVRPGPRSQIDVRARGAAAFRVAECLSLTALPGANRFVGTPLGDCFWLRPDEWLVVGEPSSREWALAALESAVGRDEGAVVDVSSSRVPLEVQGLGARDLLASGCSVDLHPRVFGPGQCVQTLFGKAPVLLCQMDSPPRFRLFVRPSLLAYVVSWLEDEIRSRE
jgi:sarcosine oxidase subunit gamma